MSDKSKHHHNPPPAEAQNDKRVNRDQSETEGRIGEGKNSGVRNVKGGVQRSAESDRKRIDSMRDPDVRVGAKGVMHLDIGESICLQSGNEC